MKFSKSILVVLQKSVLALLLLLVSIVGLSKEGLCDPIPIGGIGNNFGWDVTADTPLNLGGTLIGGPVIGNGATPPNLILPGLTNWKVTVTASVANMAPGAPDIVQITGNAVHINNNPDDGEHQDALSFAFSASFAGGPPPGIALGPLGGFGCAVHVPHQDCYTLSADLQRNAANPNSIALVSLAIRGQHIPQAIPEPSTLLVLAGALAGVSWFSWWRRRNCPPV